MLERALAAEPDEHLGSSPQAVERRNSGNSGNGNRTEDGPGVVAQAEVPCDRDGSFESWIVQDRWRRVSGVDGSRETFLPFAGWAVSPGCSPKPLRSG